MKRPASRRAGGLRSRRGRGSAPRLTGGTGVSTGWWLPGAALDFDFQNNVVAIGSSQSGTAISLLSVSNNGGYVQNLAGVWSAIGSNTARRSDKGLLAEEARTNNLLQCRDMTNAAWVKGATVTVAQTQTGIDGSASSATLVTGGAVTATNTVLQTITLGSAADTYSVFIKRVTGSGVIEITPDGTTWTAVVPTSAYQQFQVQQTLANPVCGIRITANGDQVAVDFSQLETGAFATSPILTTVAAATRNADVVTVIGAGATIPAQSASMFFQTLGNEGIVAAARAVTLGVSGVGFTASTQIAASDGTNTAAATIGGAGISSGVVKLAYGLDNASMTAVANGGTKAVQSTSTWATGAAGQTATLGNASAGNRSLNGYLQRAAFALGKGVFDMATL